MDLRPTLEVIFFTMFLLDTHAEFKLQSTICRHIARQLVSSNSNSKVSAYVIKACEGEEVHFQLFLTEALNGGELSGLGLGDFTRCKREPSPH